MTITRKQQSLFPDYPRSEQIAEKDGYVTNDFHLWFSLMNQALQSNFSNEGFRFPPLNAAQIAEIQAIYTPLIGGPLPMGIPDISGSNIFDSTNRVPRVFIITYDNATPPNILTATWKTYTVT